MTDPSTLRQEILESYEASKDYEARKAYEYRKNYEARKAAEALQEAKLKALQDTIGNYGNYKYVDLEDFIDPNNQNWRDYAYRIFSPLVGIKGRVGAASPVGMFIEHIRDAKNTDDIKKQLELWNSYKPLDLLHNGESYVNHFIYGLNNAPYGGSRPVFPTTDGSNPVQTTAGGTQGAQVGNGVAKGGVQGANNGSGGTQGTQTGGTGTPSAQGGQIGKTGGTGGTYASAGVPRGGTKTIGYDLYDPNPGNVSLAYTLRNEPEQVRRAALIAKWNQEHGRSGSTYASPSISTGGTYSTGGGIKDANGNVLTNPGGNWEYQYALKNPQYGLGMMGKMSDAQKNYLQAVSDNMGFNYNFTGATRFV